MKTVVQLLAEIEALSQAQMSLQGQLAQIPFYRLIAEIASEDFNFRPEAERLAESLVDRDEPLTRSEIVEIFEGSGFQFNERHIDACKPESDAYVAEFRREQLADYRSVYGDSN